jgi:hypothetical protein
VMARSVYLASLVDAGVITIPVEAAAPTTAACMKSSGALSQ